MKSKKNLIILLVVTFLISIFPLVSMASDSDGDPLLNIHFTLVDQDDYALEGYIITYDDTPDNTLDKPSQAIANKNGLADFLAVDATRPAACTVFTPDKVQIGMCDISYQQADTTSVTKNKDGDYTINYSTANSPIYIALVADPNGNDTTLCQPVKASDVPLDPANPRPTPSQSPTPTASPSPTATATATPTPTPTATATPTPVTEPVVKGYVIDQNGAAMVHTTILSTNEDTGQSVSGVTENDGFYELQRIEAGEHSIDLIDNNGSDLGDIKMMVNVGDTTSFITDDGRNELDVQIGLGTLYMNMQLDSDGAIRILDVSDTPLNSPVVTTVPTATVEPTPTVEPMPTATGTPQPEDEGLLDFPTLLIILVIIAAAVVIILILVIYNRKKDKH